MCCPPVLTFVSASPAPDVATVPLLQWSLGTSGAGRKPIDHGDDHGAFYSRQRDEYCAGFGATQLTMTTALHSTQVITQAPILRVSKTASASHVNVGDALVYTLQYSNVGNQATTGVVLTDTLPAGITVVVGESTVDYGHVSSGHVANRCAGGRRVRAGRHDDDREWSVESNVDQHGRHHGSSGQFSRTCSNWKRSSGLSNSICRLCGDEVTRVRQLITSRLRDRLTRACEHPIEHGRRQAGRFACCVDWDDTRRSACSDRSDKRLRARRPVGVWEVPHPDRLTRASTLSKAILPKATMTHTLCNRRSSSIKYGRQLFNSSGVGLLSGGAQRPAAVM